MKKASQYRKAKSGVSEYSLITVFTTIFNMLYASVFYSNVFVNESLSALPPFFSTSKFLYYTQLKSFQ